jgi:hypothetical protein
MFVMLVSPALNACSSLRTPIVRVLPIFALQLFYNDNKRIHLIERHSFDMQAIRHVPENPLCNVHTHLPAWTQQYAADRRHFH